MLVCERMLWLQRHPLPQPVMAPVVAPQQARAKARWRRMGGCGGPLGALAAALLLGLRLMIGCQWTRAMLAAAKREPACALWPACASVAPRRVRTDRQSVERGQCPPRISLNETPRTKRDDAENEQTVHNMTLHRQRGTAVRLPPAQTPLKRVRRQPPLAPHPPPLPSPWWPMRYGASPMMASQRSIRSTPHETHRRR